MESWCHVVWHYGTPIIPNRTFGFHTQLPLDKKWPMKSIPSPQRNTRWLLDCLITWLFKYFMIAWLIERFGRASHSGINTIKHSSNNSSIYTLTHFINLFQRSCSLYYFFFSGVAHFITFIQRSSRPLAHGLWLATLGSSIMLSSAVIYSIVIRSFSLSFPFHKGKKEGNISKNDLIKNDATPNPESWELKVESWK